MGQGRDLYGIDKFGRQIPIEVGLNPMTNKDLLFVTASVLDISERRAIQKTLMNRNEELQQFAYRTSHDLKAPLRSIAGLARFILEDNQAGNTEEVGTNIQKILSLSEKLLAFVMDILNLTRADYGVAETRPWEIKEAIASVQEKLGPLAEQDGVEFRFLLEHEQIPVGDPIRYSQILENLVSNAIKYRDEGKHPCFVEIRSKTEGGQFILQVRDNGLGIPSERRPEVFQMFKRFHKNSVDGSGLGLYLVKKLVDASGGGIDLDSGPEGTCFTVRLPLQPFSETNAKVF
jgi:signal transduction histidine kinase